MGTDDVPGAPVRPGEVDAEIRHRVLFDGAPHGIVFQEASGRIVSANPAAARILGLALDQLRDCALNDPRWRAIREDGAPFPGEEHPAMVALRTCKPVLDVIMGVFHPASGTCRWLQVSSVPLSLAGQERPFQVCTTLLDVTDRRQVEATLRDVLDTAPVQIWAFDGVRYSYVNKAYYTYTGLDRAAELTPEVWISYVHADDLASAGAVWAAAWAAKRAHDNFFRLRNAAGEYRDFWCRAVPIFNSDGSFSHFQGFNFDVTERRRAEAERAALAENLQQAQKMEAVGRLAGGVAHDFNNMLTAILGSAELAMEKIDRAHPLHADLDEIRSAATRSALLTRQLLAFARRETVQPVVLDLNQAVQGALKMLRRLIGENITLDWRPARDLWTVHMDPSQVDQILANLCVNARDAIADVGALTIETGNVTADASYCAANQGLVPGEYVRLVVRDTGSGMDAETRAHLFEPFFTTKAKGMGTGLGLATVYGIVTQHAGFIRVSSEPGAGSTFTIHLPRHLGPTEPPSWSAASAPAARGHETVLLVEDEPNILRVAGTMLERQGYTVLSAPTPGEAMRFAREHVGEIHLLLTDVVMPEMNGWDLGKAVVALRPETRRLYMSGFTSRLGDPDGVVAEGSCFIQKPFTIGALAAKVREVLDR
jgi:PAS domain S-box-containing protein